ncbi:IclR family transcriptional regulator [Streptomyces hesseae]|uniref:IclR family transcriptional regulator n=1 Tax=Streptomyces hesseae TaxID=3075519 RepID=A0ABU2SGB2_9ACTN|nr:IclR family transcriptional regulator [Streptomyces sp. DSM 40473]MDT0447922.1 IclR family transcriptional regulator [Streptomyces sp. DSM 40473]
MYRNQAPVGRTAATLRLLDRHPEDGVTRRRLTDTLDIPAVDATALLRSLEAEGLVRQEPDGAFRPAGPLSGPAADCNDLRAAAMNWADGLAAHSGMSVHLAVAHPEGAQIVHHVFRPDNTPQRLETGDVRPATGALGRALAGPCDGRLVYATDAGRPGAASLAIAVRGPGPEPVVGALSLTGPCRALDPARPESGRCGELLREAAVRIASALAAGC